MDPIKRVRLTWSLVQEMLAYATLNDTDETEEHQLRAKFEFFLGGRDLEMLTIRQLLQSLGDISINDRSLGWGEKTSDYRAEITSCQAAGRIPVLVELRDDLGLVAAEKAKLVVIIDHHGERAGRDVSTSLEQVFALLELPREQWSRQMALVAANDRGYVAGMKAIGATPEEIRQIRDADRAAQGITVEQEQIGRLSAEAAESSHGGRLKIVRLSHDRAATVTDALIPELGGVGYENLLIFCPSQTLFYGSGWCIRHLKSRYPGGWSGGELPDTGYWGIDKALEERPLRELLETTMTTKPASEIAVQAFHHTLLWPLIMRGPHHRADDEEHDGESSIKPFLEAFDRAGWKERSGTNNQVHEDFSYEEIVYFHPFVRDFLFGDGKTPLEDRAVRRFRRDDLTAITVSIEPPPESKTPQFTVALRVERAELLLIRPRIVLLMVEVSNRETGTSPPQIQDRRTPLSLAQVLYLQSRLRHIYPPHFTEENGGTTKHGDCPTDVHWGKAVESPSCGVKSPRPEFDTFVRKGAEPPVYAHWRQLFENSGDDSRIEPLKSAADRTGKGLFLQQLLDDRMPAMSFIAVERPDEISQDDEDRFPAFDSPDLEYQLAFRDRLRESFRYTRFRHWGTTYYCNGTSFTTVSNTGDFSNMLLTISGINTLI